MTDNEIIKALECCIKHTECPKCPMRGMRDCMSKLNKNALDLINRQKENYELETERLAHYMKMLNFSIEERNKLSAEIERLEKELDVYKEANILIAKQRDGRDEDIANLEAENETLKTNNTSLCVTLQSRARVERAEAIKEFAERLKGEYDGFDERAEEIYYKNLIRAIDNLVKEMVGE